MVAYTGNSIKLQKPQPSQDSSNKTNSKSN
uniref:Uncharacterized protein n=1 Tax=Rhizophora mucronata TaxID=61149 RepID=A0A2P2QDQ6_RHIMU